MCGELVAFRTDHRHFINQHMDGHGSVHPLPPPPPPQLDQRSGFDAATHTFHSLRPQAPLPPPSLPLSFASYVFSLLPSPHPSNPALVDAATGSALSFPALHSQVHRLAAAIHSEIGLAKGDVAFVLAPSSLHIPLLYLALLSLGVVVSPANPASTASDLTHLVGLSRPRIAFASSTAASKLPPHLDTVLLDSTRFLSLLAGSIGEAVEEANEVVLQSDVAAIQYSSGTTGRMKAVALSHRSFMGMVVSFNASRDLAASRRRKGAAEVRVLGAPLFHSMGFMFVLKGIALGETTVVMSGGGGGVRAILQAAERYRATHLSVSPPVVVAMTRWAERIELGALEQVICGGAPLHETAAKLFMTRFPGVELCQGYGSTEAGGIARMIGYKECCYVRSVGRLTHNVEAKIVDTITGESLSVGQVGELCVKGPSNMIGYVGDADANVHVFDYDGWLRTGDLCYIDHDGFLYIIDRLKELIKYKAYQVPPSELEHLLLSMPGVADAAVAPYPDEEVGEIPMAFIVRQPRHNLEEQQIIDRIAEQVAPYKKIRKVVFTDFIPKTASGKILRAELRKHPVFSSMSRL